jgi:hypothetical protein
MFLFENYREIIPVKNVIEWKVIVVVQDNCRNTHELLRRETRGQTG